MEGLYHELAMFHKEKNWRILRIVLLKAATSSSTEVFSKAFFQSNRSIARLLSSVSVSW